MVRSAELFFTLLTSPGFVQEPLRQAGERLGALDARWREQRPRDEEAAASLLRLMVPQVVDAALDQIDLNELVAERIELDQVIDRLDLDRAIARLNIDAIVSRIDLDRIVERIDVRAIVPVPSTSRVPLDTADRGRWTSTGSESRGRAVRRRPDRLQRWWIV
jgi:hypothetical protein